MNATLYIITAQTNIHAGSGSINYGLIDNLVQRDALTGLPCIFSHSLKGSIREHCEPLTHNAFMDTVFGKTNKKGGKTNIGEGEGKSGEYIFMQANLLSIPIRSNVQPFFRCTSYGILKEWRDTLEMLGVITKNHNIYTEIEHLKDQNNALILQSGITKCHLEDKKEVTLTYQKSDELMALLDENTIILPDKILKDLTDDHHLPVIARNHLENGQSENLWYEQILPRQTKFYAIVLHEKPNELTTHITNRVVQIGANATVGYGYCNFEEKSDFKKKLIPFRANL